MLVSHADLLSVIIEIDLPSGFGIDIRDRVCPWVVPDGLRSQSLLRKGHLLISDLNAGP